MGKVVMNGTVSVDGFIAADNDEPGPLFAGWPAVTCRWTERRPERVATSFDYTRPYWDQIGVTIAGRHVFDITDGWDGKPPSGIDHVVVVSITGRSLTAGTPTRRSTSSTASRQPWPRRRTCR